MATAREGGIGGGGVGYDATPHEMALSAVVSTYTASEVLQWKV
jgi:hypothetical protein